MALTDPFDFTHNGKTRRVDMVQIRYNVQSGQDISASVKALTWLPNSDDIDAQHVTLAGADFDLTEMVTAFTEEATALGLTLTPAQIGSLIVGSAERMIRDRWEDA